MTRFVEMRIELPDGDEDRVTLAGMEVTAASEEIDPEAIPAVLLKGIEMMVQGRITEALTTSRPMLSEEIVDNLSASEARLTIVDMLLHLPSTANGAHMETTIPR